MRDAKLLEKRQQCRASNKLLIMFAALISSIISHTMPRIASALRTSVAVYGHLMNVLI